MNEEELSKMMPWSKEIPEEIKKSIEICLFLAYRNEQRHLNKDVFLFANCWLF